MSELGPRRSGPSGWCGQLCGGSSPAQGAPSVVRLRSSPVEAREGEADEAVPMRGSPEHGQWQRSSTTAAEASRCVGARVDERP
jgi:hypothetical protein